MPSEVHELRVEGGRVNQTWCMGEVSHSYGGLVGAGIELEVGRYAEQSLGRFVACRVMPELIQSAR